MAGKRIEKVHANNVRASEAAGVDLAVNGWARMPMSPPRGRRRPVSRAGGTACDGPMVGGDLEDNTGMGALGRAFASLLAQDDRESTSPTRFAGDSEGGTEQFSEFPTQVQTETGAFAPTGTAADLSERMEKPPLILGADANPGIGHRNLDARLAVRRLKAEDGERNAAVVGELHGVVAEIKHDLL